MSFINWGSESPEQLRLRKQLEEQMLLEQAMYNAATAAAAAGSGGLKKAPIVYYLRANSGNGEDPNTEPWDGTANLDEMNAVFGNDWKLDVFETLDPFEVFSPTTTYVFIDGSNNGANSLKDFLYNVHTPLQEWVYAGGNLFLNSAPNEGGNINFGFGGTVLIYDDGGSESSDATIASGQESHPIFTGPGACGDSWTGDDFSHALIDGDVNPLIVTPGEGVICGEISWGAGKVIFGGMTLTEFHEPKPEAIYLRQNIHAYLSGKSYTPQLGMRRSKMSNGEVRRSSKG
jgi:hypothetical protein